MERYVGETRVSLVVFARGPGGHDQAVWFGREDLFYTTVSPVTIFRCTLWRTAAYTRGCRYIFVCSE